MTGGTVNSGAWFSVGLEGNGTFNQSGGTVNVIGGFAAIRSCCILAQAVPR